MGTDLRTQYLSHPGKLLSDHLQGVAAGVRKRTSLKAAELAAIFHDLGKINLNFQAKIQPSVTKLTGSDYSSHAYLSALAWMCFCQVNPELRAKWFGSDSTQIFSIAAMVARHHGNLPDFEEGIFKQQPREALKSFLAVLPHLPISEFLQHLLPHNSFSVFPPEQSLDKILRSSRLSFEEIKKNKNPLDFFLDTQFGFACLIESDKRDASDNKKFKRDDFAEYFRTGFPKQIEAKLMGFKSQKKLDELRTQIREEARQSIQHELAKPDNQRVFTLSSPTGSGKTVMLLTQAKEIIAKNPGYSVVYALPFLSITEQVEGICKEIFSDDPEFVLRIDSKSENSRIQQIQAELENKPEQINELTRTLLQESFSENTFDHPFIITTFVQLFETLVSNRNSTLLRLPNFAKTIFLIDEIQALPPRLYLFFAGLLDEFCRRFDSYAILSTATMPHLEMPAKDVPDDENALRLFNRYQTPKELLSDGRYFKEEVFNRYKITMLEQVDFQVRNLADVLLNQSKSTLVILNTIDDTKELYSLVGERMIDEGLDAECVLLNTHFTPKDRREKINFCQQRLASRERVILISTQLIEAGVDIDFPVLFRDLCPLPSLIQSAGRCNRNGSPDKGKVFLFALKKESGKLSSSLIYRDEARVFLDFCLKNIKGTISEIDLFEIQKRFFEYITANLKIGLHKQSNVTDGEINMVKCVNQAAFDTLGWFRLIDDSYFGFEHRYYIPQSYEDDAFEQLKELVKGFSTLGRNYEAVKRQQLRVEQHLRAMAENIVTIRLSPDKKDFAPHYELNFCKMRETRAKIEPGQYTLALNPEKSTAEVTACPALLSFPR